MPLIEHPNRTFSYGLQNHFSFILKLYKESQNAYNAFMKYIDKHGTKNIPNNLPEKIKMQNTDRKYKEVMMSLNKNTRKNVLELINKFEASQSSKNNHIEQFRNRKVLTKDQLIRKIMTKVRLMTKPQLKRFLTKLNKLHVN